MARVIEDQELLRNVPAGKIVFSIAEHNGVQVRVFSIGLADDSDFADHSKNQVRTDRMFKLLDTAVEAFGDPSFVPGDGPKDELFDVDGFVFDTKGRGLLWWVFDA